MIKYTVWSVRLGLAVATGLTYAQAILVQDLHEDKYHAPALILEA